MKSVIQSMSEQLMAIDNTLHGQLPTLKEYENFLKEYAFDKLKGISLGVAFTERFNVNSYYLKIIAIDIETFGESYS